MQRLQALRISAHSIEAYDYAEEILFNAAGWLINPRTGQPFTIIDCYGGVELTLED